MELQRNYGTDGKAANYEVKAWSRGADTAKTTASVTADMNYLMMQLPYDVGGKYYFDNILIEKVCDADAFVGKTSLIAESKGAAVHYEITSAETENTADKKTITSFTVKKTGDVSSYDNHTAYIASYDDSGMMTGIKSVKIPETFGSSDTQKFDLNGGFEYVDKYRIFIFDSNLLPLAKAYPLK